MSGSLRLRFARPARRTLLAGIALLGAAPAPLCAQAPTAGWRAEFLMTAQAAADKYLQLAEAMAVDQFTWRPGEGVRSVAEVLLHVASSNYRLGSRLGTPVPAGVDARGLERSTTEKDAVIRHLRESFAFFRRAVEAFPENEPGRMIPWFGPPEVTARHYLYILATHNGEHLGQMIAYARMNGVRPPWSGGD